jgi:hypothetical protein
MIKINSIFMVGNLKDAENPEAQKKAKIFAVLKCTDVRFGDGSSGKKLPFHEEYLNLAFADNGSCPDEGWKQAQSWLTAVEKVAKARKLAVLVCSDTGTGKAPRVIACHLGGWTVAGYDKAMKKMPKSLKFKALPAFEAMLKKELK